MREMYPTPSLLDETRSRRDVLVSVAVPALNESETLPTLYEAIRTVMEGEQCRFELVVADNGSSDNSLQLLRALAESDPRVRYVPLSRNFGHQGGLIAALEHAEGDVVICMDADLQHPPATIPRLLEKWEQGYDVVNTRKQSRERISAARRLNDEFYYWLVSRLSGIPMRDRQSDFRLMDRRALDALMTLPEKGKILRGLSYWIGFVHTTVPYDVGVRHAGKSRYRLSALVRFATDGLISFSVLPLRLFSMVGTCVSLGALLYGAFVLAYWLIEGEQSLPSGWTSLAIGVYFLGGVQLVGIGVLGEYIGRIYDETRSRPSYLVRGKRGGKNPTEPGV